MPRLTKTTNDWAAGTRDAAAMALTRAEAKERKADQKLAATEERLAEANHKNAMVSFRRRCWGAGRLSNSRSRCALRIDRGRDRRSSPSPVGCRYGTGA